MEAACTHAAPLRKRPVLIRRSCESSLCSYGIAAKTTCIDATNICIAGIKKNGPVSNGYRAVLRFGVLYVLHLAQFRLTTPVIKAIRDPGFGQRSGIRTAIQD